MADTEDKKEEKSGKKVVSKEVLEQLRQEQAKRRKRFFIIVAVLAVLLVLILCYCFGVYEKLLGLFGVRKNLAVTPTMTEISYTPKGEFRIGAADDCLFVYDENGMTALDADGAWKWNLSCRVTHPVLRSYDTFLLLLDQQEKSVWNFNGEGLVWQYNARTPVLSAFASADGKSVVLLCEQDDFETSAVYLQWDGKNLKEIFTRKFGTYYMIAGDCGKGSAQLALSGMYSEGGTLTGTIVFLRAQDGEVFSTETVEGEIYPEAFYLSGDTLFAANGESLRLLKKSMSASRKKDRNEELWSRKGGRTLMTDFAVLNGKYGVAAFCADNTDDSQTGASTLTYFDASGKQCREISVDGRVRDLASRGDTVAACTENSLILLHENGQKIGEYTLPETITDFGYLNGRNLIAACEKKLFRVSFEG